MGHGASVRGGFGLADVDLADREKLVELRPRMAKLNPCSMSFGPGEFRNPPAGVRRLAARMRDLDVKPELEIYGTGHLDACLRLYGEGLLDRIGRDGVDFDREEHTDGICAVAAVVDPHDPSPMAVSVPIPAQRFHGRAEELARARLTTCAQIRAESTG
ncbi:3-keto-5-aminohexanoate cleavage protein [Actinoplanes subtropicus]|uniref:3-keto-5-aminohexanoate cleavage protein n=1 Tax=Actinoplanes subtropicus TaxID=543632 RepID=UPI0004C47067|nr:3-keto-5-aminohexanoate cleavage protein [Actinoplanes subtropicus]